MAKGLRGQPSLLREPDVQCHWFCPLLHQPAAWPCLPAVGPRAWHSSLWPRVLGLFLGAARIRAISSSCEVAFLIQACPSQKGEERAACICSLHSRERLSDAVSSVARRASFRCIFCFHCLGSEAGPGGELRLSKLDGREFRMLKSNFTMQQLTLRCIVPLTLGKAGINSSKTTLEDHIYQFLPTENCPLLSPSDLL